MSKISLHNVDIIMSYRGNTSEREENLYAVLHYFDLAHSDYTIWLMEADAVPKFDWHRLSNPRVQHVFTYNNGPFPKAHLYNLGAKISQCEALFFMDIDCVPNPHVLSSCIYNILTVPDNDVICPYHGAINVTGDTKQRFLQAPSFDLFKGISKTALTDDTSMLYEGSMGGAFIFRRSTFIRIGGLDTSFIGWGGEDNELFFRSQRLGVNWVSMDTPLFHLHHDSTSRDEWTAKAEANARRAYLSQTMPMSELESHTERLKRFFV